MTRTNKNVCISFGQEELELLELLDEGRKKTYQTRSGWIKQKIREEFANKSNSRTGNNNAYL